MGGGGRDRGAGGGGGGESTAHFHARKDLTSKREEYLFPLPKALQQLVVPHMEDARDLPIVNLYVNIAVLVLPSFVAMVWLAPESHALGAAYLAVNYVTFLQRFILALHFSEHRRLFKVDGALALLNHLPAKVLAPIYGIPAGMYRLHHCVMHHTENNFFPYDLSSTEPYQRDSVAHFLWYWARFTVGAWVELPLYAARRGRWAVLAEVLAVEACFLTVVRLLHLTNPTATLWVLLIPFFITSVALMLGNWSQHIFVNPKSPASNYSLTYNCLNCPDNRRTFNDGYHIIHHANSKLHWSELPQRFLDTLGRHADEDALCFHGVGFMDVGIAVFTGRLGWLAERVVPCGGGRGEGRSKEDTVSELRARLVPIRRQ